MYFSLALKEYLKNFHTALVFAVLLVFVLPFTFFEHLFISSGLVGFEFGVLGTNILSVLVSVFFVLLFLFFYSIFVSLVIFAVRKDLSKVKVNYYLREKLSKFSFKLFFFYSVFSLFFLFLGSLLVSAGASLPLVALLVFLASLPFFFFPQALIVDECGLRAGLHSGYDFLVSHPRDFLFLIGFGSVAVFVLPLIEFGVDFFAGGMGPFFSLVVSFVFIVPFFEIWKTVVFMKKFDIIASSFHNLEAKIK
jgi:hypothetical protein